MANVKYTQEMLEYIASIVDGRFDREVADMVNAKFGTDFQRRYITACINNHNIKRKVKPSLKGMASIIPKEIDEYMRNNIAGTSVKDLTEMINNEFGTDYTVGQIKAYKTRHHYKNGLDAKFKTGTASYNKGKKQTEFMSAEAIEKTKATRFQKGNNPHNALPVGTIVINSEGYYIQKVAEPREWEFVHRMIYESYYGKIPEDMPVIFLDGNKQNLDISNLKMIERKELGRMNLKQMYGKKELTEVTITNFRLENLIRVKKKELCDKRKDIR